MKNEAIETIEYKGYTINIYPDYDFAETPRNWDNLGKVICWHRNYDLSDKGQMDLWSEKHECSYKNIMDYIDMKDGEFCDVLTEEQEAVVILPVYMYEHSGITISTSSFACRWDSGQIGYIYATKKDIMKDFNVTEIDEELKDKVEKILIQEIKTYDDYVTGNVYGYSVEETGDSCYGYLGDYEKNGMIEDAKSNIDFHIEQKRKQANAKLKTYIKKNVPLNKRTLSYV